MPMFEYQCEDCCTTFERLVSITQSAHSQDCPHCQSPNTAKQFSTFSTSYRSSGTGSMVSTAPPAFS